MVPLTLRARPPALARRGRGRGGRFAAAGTARHRLGRERDRRLPARGAATAATCSARCPTVRSTRPSESSASTTSTGRPIAVLFRYSAHPVTVGSRSQVASADYPGPAREVLERNLGGLALFLQGCGGNVNPRVGIGYEVDCSDTKNRVGLELGGEALRVAARIRTNRRAGERRPLGNVPNILFTPWEPVEDGPTCTRSRGGGDDRRARVRRAAVARASARDPGPLGADCGRSGRPATR